MFFLELIPEMIRSYNKLKVIPIMIDESLIEEPIDITNEIKEGGCLMIFDDCNTIQNDKLKKEVEKIRLML